MIKITHNDLAELSPNMRLQLKVCEAEIKPKDTYWVTLQGMASRGLVERPKYRHQPYPLTLLGLRYKAALEDWTP